MTFLWKKNTDRSVKLLWRATQRVQKKTFKLCISTSFQFKYKYKIGINVGFLVSFAISKTSL